MPDPASPTSPYRGRFAPSPTGELHMGSLVAATASYLEARTRNGEWLVRIEDLDPPREVAGSAASILATLERCGFCWDGEPVRQSTRNEAYARAMSQLIESGFAFPCGCSRSEVEQQARRVGAEGPIYPGTCRKGLPEGREERAIRLRAPNSAICFADRLRGRICQDVATEVGDFVIRRADGFFAYQLAVVVDDAWQGVTDVVRGADLLLSTPRQVWLQRLLGLPTPGYLHIPLLLDANGQKLSKQLDSLPVDRAHPASALVDALTLLRQQPPRALARGSVDGVWTWALANWRIERLRDVENLSENLVKP